MAVARTQKVTPPKYATPQEPAPTGGAEITKATFPDTTGAVVRGYPGMVYVPVTQTLGDGGWNSAVAFTSPSMQPVPAGKGRS